MKQLIAVDGNSLMHRAFYALPDMTNTEGVPTGALHGFLSMLLKLVSTPPDYLVVAFDLHGPTFRHEAYDAYKAGRRETPEPLRAQFPELKTLLTEMGITVCECPRYEADDILGTLSQRCEDAGREILLVTGDRDSFQLTGEYTTILYTRKGIADTVRVTPEYVRATYGLSPGQLIDVKSLMGDASDNIPGIPGVGEKTALRLVQTYGSLEDVLTRGAAEEKGKLRERLAGGAEIARMSYALAKIVRSAPIQTDFDAWRLTGLAHGIPRLKELGMNVAARRLVELTENCASAPIARKAPQEALNVEEFRTIEELRARCADARSAWTAIHLGAEFSIATESFCARLALGGGDLLSAGITESEALEAALPLIARTECLEVWNVKALAMEIEALKHKTFDVMLAAYVLNPQRDSFAAEALCEAADAQGFEQCPAIAVHRLAEIQRGELKARGAEAIFETVEMPLAFVAREMEQEGFLVDADALRALGNDFDAQIARISDEIMETAGERINLNSPKQLGELLFDRLGLKPAPKKTARGYSTNAEVLENLAETYPICAKILEWRKYQKLRSTYIDSLIRLRDENGRVHTHFDQVGTATGRLSSNDPNLQNIPVRTEIGREIRRAFVAKAGCTLIDADYSQIELRVLAHISGDETMIAAFNAGEDIHARTAAEVYGVPLEAVTHQMRSASKAVNFGIVYGISDFALAKNIGVSRREAREFIDRYLERYPGVKRYMETSVETAKARGYAETLFGRRRYLPELTSANFNVRSFGERCAMNSPIQGTAADIIKLAMIRAADALREEGLRARLILQVHDELILEAPTEEVERASELLRTAMENVVRLSVPLKTDLSTGGDWRACK